MLKANEIYLLNEALDGNEIYGIDKKKALMEELNANQKAIESLKEKKVMNEDNTINELSYLIIENLKQFKQATSYLWLNDILFSMDNTDFMIFFRKDSNSNEFEFKKTTNAYLMYALMKEYEFLGWGSKKVIKEVKSLSNDKFVEDYVVAPENENCLILRKEEHKRIKFTSSYVAYIAEGYKVLKYDAMKEEIYEIDPRECRLEIAKLLGLNPNEVTN